MSERVYDVPHLIAKHERDRLLEAIEGRSIAAAAKWFGVNYRTFAKALSIAGIDVAHGHKRLRKGNAKNVTAD